MAGGIFCLFPVSKCQRLFDHVWRGVQPVRHFYWQYLNILFPTGMNAETLDERFMDAVRQCRGYNCHEDDFTLFDSTQSHRTHQFGNRLLRRAGFFFATAPCLKDCTPSLGGSCTGRTGHGLRFKENCTMKSGSPQACILNTIINVVTCLFTISKASMGVCRLQPRFALCG